MNGEEILYVGSAQKRYFGVIGMRIWSLKEEGKDE